MRIFILTAFIALATGLVSAQNNLTAIEKKLETGDFAAANAELNRINN